MIVVAPLAGLAAAIAHFRPSHLVSLASPGSACAAPPADGIARLSLEFNDIVTPRDDLLMASTDDIAAIIDFARDWDGTAPLLVQCWAGVSRSPAAAYIMACALAEPGAEVALAERLRRAAPFATPNAHMIALADALLGRDGRMTAAIAGIARGVEVGLGAPFVLALRDGQDARDAMVPGRFLWQDTRP